MKLRYIIPTLIAVIAVLVGCSDNFEPSYLSDLRVSKSYMSIDEAGNPINITVTSASEWAFDAENIPSWLTVSPTSGSAGQTTVTFKADAMTDFRSAKLTIVSGTLIQEINIVQGKMATDTLTVTQAVEMVKAGTQPGGAVFVRGIVCKIDEISASYGNATYYLSDDGTYAPGNNLEIYRGAWLNGEKFTKGDEFDLGDIMVIKGNLVDYKGQPETPQGGCQVISIKKSLVKIISPVDAPVINAEGGKFEVKVAYKGIGLAPVVPEDVTWLRMTNMVLSTGTVTAVTPNPADTAVVTFYASPNEASTRDASIEFKCTDGTNSSKISLTVTQLGDITDATVATFLAASVGEAQYRLTGVVDSLYYYKGNVAGFYLRDYSGTTMAYNPTGLADVKVSDVVTVVGKRAEYKEVAQLSGGAVEKIISVVAVSLADFLAKEVSSDVYYLITGTIKEIANPTFGNVYLTDGTTEVYVFGCYPGWGATGDFRKGLFEKLGIKVGDKLSVIGVRGEHNGTQQMANGIYFSHESAE